MQASRVIQHVKYQISPIAFCLKSYRLCSSGYNYFKNALESKKNCISNSRKIQCNFISTALGQRTIYLCHCNVSTNSCSLHFSPLKRTFSKSSLVLCKWDDDTEQREVDLLSTEFEEEKIFEKWTKELIPIAGVHSVFVIQPHVKWGNKKKRNTTPELQLAEAVALVQSLQGWKVVDKVIIGLLSFEKKIFFGSGNFESLKQKVRRDERITAVFISTKTLRGIQHRELQSAFRVPVFDRYSIIIHLFRQHAVTREAKLQVAMAEIPYIRSQLRGLDPSSADKRGGSSGTSHSMGGGGETTLEIHKQVLVNRENKVKQALEKLRNHRQLLRRKRSKLEYPIVAVVGYTNSGKTSLIKALTGDKSMQPKNQLFATLDVTTHIGMLPCRLQVLFVDTIGFISDIPTNLLESFVATLEDALLADIILHVRDISHPDISAQTDNVNNTLQRLLLSSDIVNNIVVADNKIDLIQSDQSDADTSSDTGVRVSAITHSGLDILKKKIEETLLHVTGRTSLIIRVPMGGKEASWLYKEAAVGYSEADPDNSQFLLMHVIITKAQLSKFRYHFIKNDCDML